MKFLSYKTIYVVLAILFIILASVAAFLFFTHKISINAVLPKPTPVDISTIKASIDTTKIPDATVRNTVESIKNINIQLAEYKVDATKYPIAYHEPTGNYEYNITFTPDGFNILFEPDATLFANKVLLEAILTRLVIAGAQQKSDKNITSGSLFDKQTLEDHVNYSNKAFDNSELSKLLIVNLE